MACKMPSLMLIKNYIGGQFVAESTLIDLIEPATGQSFGQCPNSASDTVDQAVEAARQAYATWSRESAETRSLWLMELADAVERNADSLAELESQDSGKPVHVAAQVDIPRAVANLRFFANAATQFASESHSSAQMVNYTLRAPLGPVACISPWNLPLYLFTWKIAPALAAGNTVVAKPSEVTPATAFRLAELAAEIGFPDGVLNIIHGDGPTTGQPLVTHPNIQAVSFTGSTRAGQWIAENLAGNLKKTSLELGGKNPTLIFSDADLDHAVPEAVRAGFSNQGQICLCGSRILVDAKIYEEFKARFVASVKALKVGDPRSSVNQQGALVSAAHQEKVLACIQRARDEGGNILCGGEALRIDGRCQNGYFVAPTVIEGLDQQCATNQEEIFGPVVTIEPFATEAEAISKANAVDYGLAAMIFSRDIQRCHRVARDVEAGIVWINTWLARDLRTPFGGVKSSGLGREGGFEAMRFFTEPKNVCISLS